jgi:hypothetical protein
MNEDQILRVYRVQGLPPPSIARSGTPREYVIDGLAFYRIADVRAYCREQRRQLDVEQEIAGEEIDRAQALADAGSWAVEVIADDSGTWAGNGMRYPSEVSAWWAAKSLATRWTLVREVRVVESPDPVNATEDGRPL